MGGQYPTGKNFFFATRVRSWHGNKSLSGQWLDCVLKGTLLVQYNVYNTYNVYAKTCGFFFTQRLFTARFTARQKILREKCAARKKHSLALQKSDYRPTLCLAKWLAKIGLYTILYIERSMMQEKASMVKYSKNRLI